MRITEKLKIFYPLQLGKDNPHLRTPTTDIPALTEEIKDFAEILLALMREYDGVGLAAPQIGKGISMIATTQRKKMPTGKNPEKDFLGETILINPKITKTSDEELISEEACLSLPQEKGYVHRRKRVEVEYLALDGKIKQQKFSGFNACIIQHEIDHLHGILFTDKLIEKK